MDPHGRPVGATAAVGVFRNALRRALKRHPDLVDRVNISEQGVRLRLDTVQGGVPSAPVTPGLENAYDLIAELFTPNWGETGVSGGAGRRALRIAKARGAAADLRAFPYTITQASGITVQKDFYTNQAS